MVLILSIDHIIIKYFSSLRQLLYRRKDIYLQNCSKYFNCVCCYDRNMTRNSGRKWIHDFIYWCCRCWSIVQHLSTVCTKAYSVAEVFIFLFPIPNKSFIRNPAIMSICKMKLTKVFPFIKVTQIEFTR